MRCKAKPPTDAERAAHEEFAALWSERIPTIVEVASDYVSCTIFIVRPTEVEVDTRWWILGMLWDEFIALAMMLLLTVPAPKSYFNPQPIGMKKLLAVLSPRTPTGPPVLA